MHRIATQGADILTLLCKKASASKNFTLAFFSALMRAMEETKSERNVATLVAHWKTAASALGSHVDKHQEVDQRAAPGFGRVEHDISGVRDVLEFPLKHLRAETERQLWKQWGDLLKQGRARFNHYFKINVQFSKLKLPQSQVQLDLNVNTIYSGL